MSYKFTCHRCGLTKFAQLRGPREFCAKCAKIISQRKDKLSTHVPVPPRSWKMYSKDNILQDLDWFVRRCNDLGASGDVVVIQPGHPMFEEIARQCTHIKEIGR